MATSLSAWSLVLDVDASSSGFNEELGKLDSCRKTSVTGIGTGN